MKERLRKVYELSVRGEAGEKVAAQRLLATLLDKYNLTVADIEDDERTIVYFEFKNDFERQLLFQIVFMLQGTEPKKYWTMGRKKLRGFKLTKAEAAEMAFLYAEYRAALMKEMQTFYAAFIQRQRIFAPSNGEAREPLTQEEQAELDRMLEMAGTINKVSTRKRLTA